MDPVKKLSMIIDASLEDNSLEKLNEYLSSIENSSNVFNGKMISVLTRILKKSGKYEEKPLHVACVLTCIQHFVNTVTDSQKWEKVSEDISKLCELVFVISSSFIKDDALIQRVVNVISALAHSVSSVVDDLLKFLVKSVLAACLCKTHAKYTRLVVMVLIGVLLLKSSRGIRTEILPSTIHYLNDLSNYLCESDDYETQVSVVEILARSLIFIKQNDQNSLFSNNPRIREMFKKYQPFLNFDPDCRLFLNEVNESLGDNQKVFSLSCLVVCTDNARLMKPNDPAYRAFWVDFNLGSRSVSFYHQMENSEFFEMMTIAQDKVLSAVAKDSTCQARSGEKFEAVKFELTIDTSDMSSDLELPKTLKIYSRKKQFLRLEHVIKDIFEEKLKFEVAVNETSHEQTLGNVSHGDSDKLNETSKEKSYLQTSILSKFPEDKEQEANNTEDKSKTQSSENSEESDEVESSEVSQYSRFMKEKMLESKKNGIVTSRCLGNEENEAQKSLEDMDVNKESAQHELDGSVRVDTNPIFLPAADDAKENISEHTNTNVQQHSSNIKDDRKPPEKVLDTSMTMDDEVNQRSCSVSDSITKTDKCKKRENISETSVTSKKKRLYCFERSNAEDIVMSSQDQVLSVEIPTYKLKKKETYVKPQSDIDRSKVSFSYIANQEKKEPAIYSKNKEQKQFSFEEDEEPQKSLSIGDNSKNSSDSSSHQLFKNLSTKSKETLEKPQRKRKFFSDKNDKVFDLTATPEGAQWKDHAKSVYSDFNFPERKDRLKCNNTYGRTKPKRPWRRLKAAKIVSSDSDSDSQYVPPTKMKKEVFEKVAKQPPKTTRFAARLAKNKVDPIRGNVFTREMELEAANEFEEPGIKPREIVAESLMTQGQTAKNMAGKAGQGKNTGTRKKKTAKQSSKKNNDKSKKKAEPSTVSQNVLQKLSDDMTSCLDVVHYEPPEADSPLDCEDLALDILSMNDDQQKTLPQTIFKVNDMIRFGKLLIKQVQEKVQKAESLAQKEREMNFARFDYKIQASCNGLYGNCQKMESVTDKLEKLRTMLEATYSLHKDISAQINSEASKIEGAKNDLLKSINKIEKAETSSISSIFQGFGGYLKKLVLSLVKGNTTKNAITN